MSKEFNVTGSCNPQKHYMVDISGKINQVIRLIDNKEYFTICKPFQYGKTTMLKELSRHLHDKYTVLLLSFDDIVSDIYENEKVFNRRVAELFIEALSPRFAGEIETLKSLLIEDLSLYSFFPKFIKLLGHQIVIFIDDADRPGNSQPFLNFLSILRALYLERYEKNSAFHSLALSSAYDVKTLRPQSEEDKIRSIPWNIAADFNVDMSFNSAEIKTMLASYAGDKGVKMDFDAISERIYYHTGGHPYLISYLCKIIDDNLNLQKSDDSFKYWKITDIDHASQLIISKCKDISHFINLTEMLKGDLALYRIVASIIFENGYFSYSVHEPILNKGIEHGLFRCNAGRIAIHNPIYNHIIADFMSDYSAKNQQEAPDEKI